LEGVEGMRLFQPYKGVKGIRKSSNVEQRELILRELALVTGKWIRN
jgi:hypothetical protein